MLLYLVWRMLEIASSFFKLSVILSLKNKYYKANVNVAGVCRGRGGGRGKASETSEDQLMLEMKEAQR